MSKHVGNFEFTVWLGGKEYSIRAMTASEAKLKVAKQAIAQGDTPYAPGAPESLARQAVARRAKCGRALGSV